MQFSPNYLITMTAHIATCQGNVILISTSRQSQGQNVTWIPYSVLICLLEQRDVQLKKIGETCRVQHKGIELVTEGDALGAQLLLKRLLDQGEASHLVRLLRPLPSRIKSSGHRKWTGTCEGFQNRDPCLRLYLGTPGETENEGSTGRGNMHGNRDLENEGRGNPLPSFSKSLQQQKMHNPQLWSCMRCFYFPICFYFPTGLPPEFS